MTHDEGVMETLYNIVHRVVDEEIAQAQAAMEEAIEECNVSEKELLP